MQSILIVGAGRQGKGFLGETYDAAGWKVSFIDKDPNVIHALKKGQYSVKLYRQDDTVSRVITGYGAYLYEDDYCENAIIDADIIALCIYPEDIPEAAARLGRALTIRAEQDSKNVTILSCTNKNHIIPMVQSCFEDAMDTQKAKQWIKEHAAIRDVIVRRSTDAQTSVSLEIVSTATMTMLIQKPIFTDISSVEWMELTDNLEALKDIKLYTYNAPHAACAFAGHLKGYKTINESAADPEIAALMHDVLTEAIHGLSKEFNTPEEEIWKFCTMPKTKSEMDDAIFRVAKDPVRKLGRNDRLTGNALFCLKYGYDPKAIILSIANGMGYDEPKDDKSALIQQLIKSKGILMATSEITGLPLDHEIVVRVAEAYKNIKRDSINPVALQK